ncbi:MAG TPA: tetratricopeptide repeat protein, partial [Candidatus Sulfopaludibacter sp.]|nr:tetratricopeptide repeat protein [Candidatus Sulfopaludibacter sp.]
GSLEKARDMARAIGSEQQEIAATLQLGTVAYLSGDLDTAGRAVNEGVERARRAGMNYLAARGTVDVGNVYFLESDFARAEASFRESLEIARRYHLRRAEARALFSLGNVQQRAGRQEQALQDVAPALTYFREGGFQVEAALCLMVIARAYRDLGNGRQAADNFERALTTAQRASDPGSALIAEQGLASVLLTYGHWPEAAERYQSARQSAAAIGDANGVVRGLTGQAAALVRLGRLTEAENALTEADRAVEKAPARANLATNILHRRAELLLSRGRNSEAAALARRAFEDKAVSRQTGHPLRCIAGVALARAGRPAAGRDLCEPAVAALVPMGDRFTTLEARLQLAEILLALRQDAAALDAVANVIGETAALDDRETGWRAWALRARALRQQGDREGARQAEQKASELMASLGWDAAVLQGYGKRADIAAWRAELSSSAAQVRTASK